MRGKVNEVIRQAIACALIVSLFGASFSVKVNAKDKVEEENYRSVKILEIAGECYVEREEKEIPCYEQMLLQEGDVLCTETGNQVQLQLDDDKYVIVEENSRVSFALEGNKKKGAIRITLEEGAILSDIRNALEEEDCYEVLTSDGVMAVRGTIFWVQVQKDEAEKRSLTRTAVIRGRVEIETKGINKQKQLILAGEESIAQSQIGMDTPENSHFLVRKRNIREEGIPEHVREMVLKTNEEMQSYLKFQETISEAQERDRQQAELERQAAAKETVQVPVPLKDTESSSSGQNQSIVQDTVQDTASFPYKSPDQGPTPPTL